MVFRLATVVTVAAIAVVMASCGPAPAPQVYPDITFTHLPPYRLDVARIDLVEAFQPPMQAPHVEHLMPMPPAAVLRRWVRDRLVADGTGNVATVTIEDASVTFDRFALNEDLKDSFTTEQAGRYDGRVAMRIEVQSTTDAGSAFASAEATRSRTVSEGLTLNQRDRILFDFAEALGQDLDKALAPNVERYLRPYLK